MNTKISVAVVLLMAVFLLGCTSSQNGYTSYNQQPQGQQPQQGQYVGGGCGVAPSASYEETPITKIFSATENF